MIAAVLLLALAQDPLAPVGREQVPAPTQPLFHQGSSLRVGRVIGAVAAAVGVILLGVSTGLFVDAANLDHQRHLVCPGNPCTEPTAYALYARAGTSQNFAVLFTGLGGALLAAGALLFVFKGDF